LSLEDDDIATLRSMTQSRTEPASRVERARILLAYWDNPSFFAVSRGFGLHHQTVQRCIERAAAEGPMAAHHRGQGVAGLLGVPEGQGLGYPHEKWTTRLLASHAREHGSAEGYPCLGNLAQAAPVRYYLERRKR
jgi:hypothetical protein